MFVLEKGATTRSHDGTLLKFLNVVEGLFIVVHRFSRGSCFGDASFAPTLFSMLFNTIIMGKNRKRGILRGDRGTATAGRTGSNLGKKLLINKNLKGCLVIWAEG